eukprot:scaffold173161_cov27-Tisochrysis_lutea.AAC.2
MCVMVCKCLRLCRLRAVGYFEESRWMQPTLHRSSSTNFIVGRDGFCAGAPLLSFGPPAEGGPPVSMDLPQSKRPRPPSEGARTSARLRSHALRPVASATPNKADMLAPPHGGMQSADSSSY